MPLVLEQGVALPPSRRSRVRSAGAMFAAAFFFSLMVISTKGATLVSGSRAPIPASEIALFRYLFGLTLLFILNRTLGVGLLGNDRRGLLWRGVSGGLSSFCYFVGIQMTTVTHATLLNSTAVVWAPLLAVYALGERLKRQAILAMVGALIGVVLITHPAYGPVRPGDAVALASGIFGGLAAVQIRRLRRGESPFAVFFYFNLFGLPLALLGTLIDHGNVVMPTLAQWLLLVVMASASFGGQILMTYGYRDMTAAQGSLIGLTSVAFASLLAHFIFHEALTLTTLSGGVLILLSAATLPLSLVSRKTEPMPDQPPVLV